MAAVGSSPRLARLTAVDVGTVWPSEADDFTPWLAKTENITLLSETLGLELEVDATEVGIGPYRADIVCRDTSDGSPDGSVVLIENQLGKTDHGHLGQLLTYAAGLDAVTVVWIARPFTDEHRAALDWLNAKTDASVHFFGVEVEVWRIGDSDMAPWFHVVTTPITGIGPIDRISEIGRQQLEFWTDYRAYVADRRPDFQCHTPRPQSWMNHAFGVGGMHFASIITSKGPAHIRVDLYMGGDAADARFRALESDRLAIEADFGESLTWSNPLDAKAARIQCSTAADFTDPAQREDCMGWLLDRLTKFHEVFVFRAGTIDDPDWMPAHEEAGA